MKLKVGALKRPTKLTKLKLELIKIQERERENMLMTNIRNKSGDITTEFRKLKGL